MQWRPAEPKLAVKYMDIVLTAAPHVPYPNISEIIHEVGVTKVAEIESEA